MKELNRTTRLIIAAIFAILVLAIGYFTMYRPNLVYKLKLTDLVIKTSDSGSLVSPDAIKASLAQKDNKTVLIDIRNFDEFSKGHLEKAINIPVHDLLNKTNIGKIQKLSKAHATIVLYGKDQLQASSPCMILQQIGIENVKVMQGGYNFFVNPPADSLYKGQAAPYISEVLRIDTAILRSAVPPKSVDKIVTPTVKKPEALKTEKKTGSAGGGC